MVGIFIFNGIFRCNLRCVHCYQDDYTDVSDLPLEELEDIAADLFATLSKWTKLADISVTGGEPFARKDIFAFLDFLDRSRQVSRIDILTNGTMLTERIAQSLKGLSKLTSIQVSLDGASPKTHDSVRGSGAFRKAMDGIRLLVRLGFDVKIMFTLQRCNMKDVPSLIDLAISEGIKGLTIERMVPIGSGRNAKESLLTPEEIRDVFKYVSDRADLECERGSQLRILKYRALWVLVNPERAKLNADTHPYKELGAVCSIGLDGICILPDATVQACRRLPIPIGNLRRDPLEKIWFTSDLLWKIGDKRNLNGECRDCEYLARCSGCRAMAYACSGDFLAEDPQCFKHIGVCNENSKNTRSESAIKPAIFPRQESIQ